MQVFRSKAVAATAQQQALIKATARCSSAVTGRKDKSSAVADMGDRLATTDMD